MHPLKKYRGFNSRWYRYSKSGWTNPVIKNRQHEAGARRLGSIAQAMGYRVEFEKPFWRSVTIMTLPFPYQADVFAYAGPAQDLVLEVDGNSHGRFRRHYKDTRRDSYFREYEGLQTIRFGAEYLTGPDSYSDERLKCWIRNGERPNWRIPDSELPSLTGT